MGTFVRDLRKQRREVKAGAKGRSALFNANHPKKGMKESVATAAAKSVLAFFLLMGNLLCDRASSMAIFASGKKSEGAAEAGVESAPPSREADDSETDLILLPKRASKQPEAPPQPRATPAPSLANTTPAQALPRKAPEEGARALRPLSCGDEPAREPS